MISQLRKEDPSGSVLVFSFEGDELAIYQSFEGIESEARMDAAQVSELVRFLQRQT